MLKLAPGSKGKKWVITGKDLLDKGIRSPQGFTFEFDNGGNYFWTTNEFAAYLFYKRYRLADADVTADFEYRRGHDNYLYKLSFSLESNVQLKGPTDYQYRPYQVSGIEYAMLSENTLIADEQRLGKTIIALGVVNNLPNVNKVLIICPKTAKFGWKEECGIWLINKGLKVQVLSAHTPYDPTSNVYITNYDNLHVQTFLQDIEFDLIIGDEVHLVKNDTARRSKYFFSIKAKKKIGMSGTPLLNDPNDLLMVLQWLDPFWKQFSIFRGRFATRSGISLELEEVRDLIRSSLLLRRLQAQAFEAEPIERRLVPLEAMGKAKEMVEHEFEAEKLGIEYYSKIRKQTALYKVPLALNHINTYSSEGEKLVVFAYHREVIERLGASLGRKAVTIYGGSTDKDRQEAVRRFREDPNCCVFIGSIPAASMALNLSASHHIIFVECDWSNGLMAQAEERCSDKLQTEPVIVEYLTFDKSIDHYMLNKTYFKDKVVDRALDAIH